MKLGEQTGITVTIGLLILSLVSVVALTRYAGNLETQVTTLVHRVFMLEHPTKTPESVDERHNRRNVAIKAELEHEIEELREDLEHLHSAFEEEMDLHHHHE